MSNTPPEEVFAPWADTDETPLIEFKQVTKRFDQFVAVDQIDLKIYHREFFALLGPSGCGKTTLMRMLAGFEQPSEGVITLAGQDISPVPPNHRPVNMMFQSYALFPHLTVYDNIAFGLRQDKTPKPEIKQRVAEIVDLVQLGDFVKRKPHQLSGGQRQRVALARSLVKKPKMLLLDEPLGALDKKLRQKTQFELVNIQESLGMTFVIVTHDQEEAMTVSTRIAIMDAGRIVQLATPTDIYESPNSRYVAEFIGDVNILPGRVSGNSEQGLQVHCEQHGVDVQTNSQAEMSNGSQVWLAIRPEKLEISLAKPSETPRANCLSGVVWDIAYLGTMSIYHVKLDSGDMVMAAQANRTRSVGDKITWEDRVDLVWHAADAVVLPN